MFAATMFPQTTGEGVLLMMLAPLNHVYILIPVLIGGLVLVFFGSRISQSLLICLSATITFLSFMLTLPTLLLSLPDHFAILVSFLLSLGAAYFGARAALNSPNTVPILSFGAGALTPNLLFDFSKAVVTQPSAGPTAAAIAFGMVASRLSMLAPAHFASASTAMIGARLASAATLMLSKATWGPAEAMGCFALAGIGYLCQVCFFVPKDEDHVSRLPYARI
jgi:hypothetical protein